MAEPMARKTQHGQHETSSEELEEEQEEGGGRAGQGHMMKSQLVQQGHQLY